MADDADPTLPQTPKRRRWWLVILQWTVVGLAFAWLIGSGRLSPNDLRLAENAARWIAAGLALIGVTTLLEAIRFHVLARGAELDVPFRTSFRLYMAGLFVNAFGPGGIGGDVVRTGWLMAATGRKASALACAAMDRAVGLFGLLNVGLVSLAMAWRTMKDTKPLEGIDNLMAGLVGAGFVGIGVVLVGGRRAAEWLAACGWPGTRMAARFIEAGLLYKRNWLSVGAGYLLSLAIHSVSIVALYAFGRSLALEAAPALVSTGVAAPITFLVNTLPVPGGGLGVGESAFGVLMERLPAADGGKFQNGAMMFLAYRLGLTVWQATGAFFCLGGWRRDAPVQNNAGAKVG